MRIQDCSNAYEKGNRIMYVEKTCFGGGKDKN